jgi:hypothetical protein
LLCFCLAVLLGSNSGESLLLSFRGFAFFFSIGCGFGLALLFCLSRGEPLLLRFLGLALCLGIGCGFGLVAVGW